MEARSDSLFCIFTVRKPFVFVGTTKPRTPSVVCAQTTATCERLPFVIHIFEPVRRHRSPRRSAKVFIAAGSEPPSDSVKPKHPIFSPRPKAGNHVCF